MKIIYLFVLVSIISLTQSLLNNNHFVIKNKLFSSTSSIRTNNRITTTYAEPKNKNSVAENQSARQLLGIKGASENKNIWAIRLQLCKPVTWIPLIWGVACGAAASGNYHTWLVSSDIHFVTIHNYYIQYNRYLI